MNAWLIVISEPVPTDGRDTRLLRTGMLARAMARAGHNVTWWTSTFDHNRKIHRPRAFWDTVLEPKLRLRMLHSPIPYRRNISIARLLNHYGVARRFSIAAASADKPDVIVCSLPTAELGLSAIKYGRANGVPVIVDARDMWPDIIFDKFPKWFRTIGSPLAAHLKRMMRQVCSQSAGITGITPAYVQWALEYAGRQTTTFDQAFPLAYDLTARPPKDSTDVLDRWVNRGVDIGGETFNICFFGNIGDSEKYDWDKLYEGASILQTTHPHVRFILCGDGDGMPALKRMLKTCSNCIFPGWIGAADIFALMKISSMGLIPYRSRMDFNSSYPNKTAEYLAGGLPVLSSVQGLLKELLHKHNAGTSFATGEELAAVVGRLSENTAELSTMKSNAGNLFKQHFDATSVHREFIAYIESVTQNHISAQKRR